VGNPRAKHITFKLHILPSLTQDTAARIGALYWSMRSLPLGGAYPILTGIGYVGTVVIGITVLKQDIGVFGIVGVACLMIGMFLVSLETH
jgi:multidrug transporter EmrE-like cation transporter